MYSTSIGRPTEERDVSFSRLHRDFRVVVDRAVLLLIGGQVGCSLRSSAAESIDAPYHHTRDGHDGGRHDDDRRDPPHGHWSEGACLRIKNRVRVEVRWRSVCRRLQRKIDLGEVCDGHTRYWKKTHTLGEAEVIFQPRLKLSCRVWSSRGIAALVAVS